jgi:Fe-S-cluster containining protein
MASKAKTPRGTNPGSEAPADAGATDADAPLAAGDFAAWLAGARSAIRGEAESDVPCGDCVGCCSSGYFINVDPDEADTLAHIPQALLFQVPGRPRGYVVMGYDEHGRCPMLRDGLCTIYAHRPRTCRAYDCRIFPATGITPDAGMPLIVRRTRQWRFSYASEGGRAEHDAMRQAAASLSAEHVSANPTGLALATIEAQAPG